MRTLFIYTLLVFFTIPLVAQVDTTLTETVDQVVISASRIEGILNSVPSSVTKLELEEKKILKQQLSLQDYIRDVPGLFTLNANNQAQDLRISIRGFGSRAAFGIRGIKLIVDGVPETTPDGQGQLDNLNLALVKNIEILRGPSSSLYGNASGGVISINTTEKLETSYSQLGIGLGSYGFQQYSLLTAIKKDKVDYILHGSYNKSEGYRAQSAFKNLNLDAKINFHINEKSKLGFNVNYSNSPVADDPGGINLASVDSDRRQARDRNVLYKTGEKIKQLKLSTNYKIELDGNAQIRSYGFLAKRDFYGSLPFGFGGIVDLDRSYMGHGSSFTKKSLGSNWINTLQFGYDIAFQKDGRKRYFNNESIQGDLTFDQNEIFFASGFYLVDHFRSGPWLINGGLRYDLNRLKADDKFLSNGDDSGELNLNSLNPSLGISFRVKNNSYVFISTSTSFETPTLSELSNSPDGAQGFNEELQSQNARNFEVGVKGGDATAGLNYGLTLFKIITSNDLVPYEIATYPDRDFFRNAGQTNRTGLELSLAYPLGEMLNLSATYTYSDFVYKDYILPSGDLNGNALPGIPKHYGTVSVSKFQEDGFIYNLDFIYTGELFTGDKNDVIVDSYPLLNIQFGYRLTLANLVLSPYFGINNLTNSNYFDNIRINAFGGRSFEPAPTRNVFGGLKFRF